MTIYQVYQRDDYVREDILIGSFVSKDKADQLADQHNAIDRVHHFEHADPSVAHNPPCYVAVVEVTE